MNRRVLSAVLSGGLMAASCSRTSIDVYPVEAGNCAIPGDRLTSGQAIALVRCEATVPSSAQLVTVLSEVDATGRSQHWAMDFVDGNSKNSLSVTPEGVILSSTPSITIRGDCGDESVSELNSDRLVPDAMDRFDKQGVAHAGLPIFILETSCSGPSAMRVSHVVAVQEADAGDVPLKWEARYDDQGFFRELCGPCIVMGVSCGPCTE